MSESIAYQAKSSSDCSSGRIVIANQLGTVQTHGGQSIPSGIVTSLGVAFSGVADARGYY